MNNESADTLERRAAAHLEQAQQGIDSSDGTPPVTHLGVVGGGQMGAGIAATAVSMDVSATVRDLSEESLDRARAYCDKVIDRTAPEEGGDGRSAQWSGTTGWAGFDGADAVIEAVFELPELKEQVLTDLGDVVADDVLLATNTSAIPIRTLAQSVRIPERFIGMHFFSPVDRMPLVELIPHDRTSADTVVRAAGLGRQLGKVGVVVGDAPGFFTSRVYARWLIEGVRLLLHGAGIDDVEAAARAVGFPVGPLRAHDEATLNLVLQASITQVAQPVMADRLDIPAITQTLQGLLDAGVEGRRQGAGFYTYDEGKRTGPNPVVATVLDAASAELTQEEIGERLLLAFASECFLCWDDGTLCHPDDGDVAAVLGIGFPRALGGPFHWADQVGAADVLARCRALGSAAFPAGQAMQTLAADGGTFHDQPRRSAPFEPTTPTTGRE